ncbi:hypothetical protein ACLIA0_14005 [Bacillaceae bacterium W0354]
MRRAILLSFIVVLFWLNSSHTGHFVSPNEEDTGPMEQISSD